MYECIIRVLNGDAKAEFTQQANLVGSCIVVKFNIVMTTMTVHIIPALAYLMVHVLVPKETQTNESAYFNYQANTAKQLPSKLSSRLCWTDGYSTV